MMTKKKNNKIKSSRKFVILASSILLLSLLLVVVLYSSRRKGVTETGPAVSGQSGNSKDYALTQTITATRDIFRNTYKNTPADYDNSSVVIKDMKLSFPKSDTYSIGYWISAKVDGLAVGASVTDLKTVDKLLNEGSKPSVQKIFNCFEGLAVFASQQPSGYQTFFQKKLKDGRFYEIRQIKKECTVLIGDFTDYLSKAESVD